MQGKNHFTGKNGLYDLAYVAYQEYRKEVVEKGVLYQRYVENFLNGHAYSICPCFRGKNEHKKNLGIIKGILQSCATKVKEIWNNGRFSKEDFMAIKLLYGTTENAFSHTYSIPMSPDHVAQSTFECYLTIEQIGLIAECANEAHLFYAKVSKDDMHALLHCQPGFHLYANRINRIAKLFDCLSYHKLVCHKWQSVLFTNKLILSPKTGKPVSPSSFSSALSKINKREDTSCEYIRMTVKRVKEMGGTDGKESK